MNFLILDYYFLKYKLISQQINKRQRIGAEKEDEYIDFEKSKYIKLTNEEKQNILIK